jgi:hypothetical protein
MKKLGELTGLAMISMNDCDLKKLETFPETLTELVALELTDNKLSGADLKALVPCKKLEFLELSGNEKITMEDLKPLASLPLREIDVTGCVAGAEEFRDAIFGTFAQLEALDGMDREGNEIESEDEDLEDLDDDEYEEEDEDDEDGDEDEDEDGDDDDDDDDEEEEEGDEEEEEEGDEEEPAEEEGADAADGKRKADEANGAPAKKAKTG